MGTIIRRVTAYVAEKLDTVNWKVDYVFSHTAPLLYEPKELFLDFIDQKKVDKSTEKWLSEIEKQLTYHTWYFGHYHGNRTMGRSKMLYEEIQVVDVMGSFLHPMKYLTTSMVLITGARITRYCINI